VVENIGVRTTTLRTVENVQVLVPNAMISPKRGQPLARSRALASSTDASAPPARLEHGRAAGADC